MRNSQADTDVVGIEVSFDRKIRPTLFVGRVFTVPRDFPVPFLRNRKVLYRPNVRWENITTHSEENAMSIDAAAWDTAEELGAEFLVSQCDDTSELIVVDKDTIISSPRSNIGEGVQFRVPLTASVVHIYASTPPNVPYAYSTKTVPALTEKNTI